MNTVRPTRRWLTAAALLLLALPAWAAAPSAAAADITVTVSTVRNQNGEIICALFDDAESFDKRIPLSKVVANARTPVARCVFRHVKAGIYAVTAIHDENGNGRLDKSFFGRPTEGYGVSNNHTYAMHAPRFGESKFSFPGTSDLLITIRLRYP